MSEVPFSGHSISITYNGEGQLLIEDVFDKKNPNFRVLGKPRVTRVRSGETIVLFVGEPGVSWKMKAFTFAP